MGSDRSTSVRVSILAGIATGAAVAVALALAAGSNAQVAPKTYYVDYAAGNDSASGLAPTAAWKHAPGDARSTGASKLLTLQPGDRVLFKGGVRYKGGFTLRAAGLPGNPVTIDGSSWGSARAYFDGSDSLSGVRACTSAADCLGSPHWQKLWRADLPDGAVWSDWLFVNDVALMPASYPEMSDTDAQDRVKYLTYSREQASLVLGCNIPGTLPAGLNGGTPVIALWVHPNKIAFGDNIQVGTTGVNVTSAHWIRGAFDPYCDRTGNYALMNLPAMVNRPGLFASSPKDKVVIFYPTLTGSIGYRVSIGGRRHGINLARADNVVIRGFTFTGFGGADGSTYAGAAILSTMGKLGITIRDNIFKAIVNVPEDMAALRLTGGSNTVIEFNQFTNMPWTPVVTVGNMPGPGLIRCNKISYVGGTGIRVTNATGVNVVGNDIRHVLGVHANGISAYLDNRDMTVSDNVVLNTHRPFTVNGPSTEWASTGTPRVTVTRNTFVSPDSEDGAATSWGRSRGYTLINNDLSSPRFAIKLAGNETGFVATGNRVVGGIAVSNKTPMIQAGTNQLYEPAGNGSTLTAQMNEATVKPEVCTRT